MSKRGHSVGTSNVKPLDERTTKRAKKLKTAEQTPGIDHEVVAGQSGQADMTPMPVANGIPTRRMTTTSPMTATFLICPSTLAHGRPNPAACPRGRHHR
jgi:hypothetical protein